MMQQAAAGIAMGICSLQPEDFEWIVPEHQKRIYRMLLFLVRDADAAETLTQECFLRAFRKRGSFRGESGLGTWLVRIAINLAHDHNRNRRLTFWRRLTRTDRIDSLPVLDAHRSPEQALMNGELLRKIWAAAEKLPLRQKTVFLLRYVDGMTPEAIAEAMDLEIGTVKTHLLRALSAVRASCMKRTV